MNILAIDTTAEWGSVAVRSGGGVVREWRTQSTAGFSHLLFDAIRELIAGAGLRLANIDCFAAANGPGSFTGVRVGLTAAKGLAEAHGKLAVGVSNLRALATVGRTEARAVILDARRGQVYAAVYGSGGQLLVPESVGDLETWLREHGASATEFITPLAFQPALPASCWTEAPLYLAAAVAWCAEQDAVDGRALDPALLDANYVRRSDAEVFWKES